MGNRLLAGLDAESGARIRDNLELVGLPVGQVLFEHESAPPQVFFPRSGVVSLLAVLENGDTGEVAMVGAEGMVGVSVLVDSQSTPVRAVVTVAGQALARNAEHVGPEFRHGRVFQQSLLRYTQALIAQMTQVSMCSRRHTVGKQLDRGLLMAFERLDRAELPITHEGIAQLLGVRREGVTGAAGRLQSSGLIRYARRRMQLLDREGLVQRSCGCCAAIDREYVRLLETPAR